MIKVTIKHAFQAAVSLRNYDGPCAQLHGHTYKVSATFSAIKTTNDMVIDFYEAKKWIEETVKPLDYSHINTVKPFDRINPTSENICYWIYQNLQEKIPNSIAIHSVTLAENDTCHVTYEPDAKNQ